MSLEECFEKSLLRKIEASREMIDKELKLAEDNLKEAESLHQIKHFNAAVIFIYTSMFHAARAILFKDGYSERSHACLILYLDEKYIKTGKLEERFILTIDNLRADRHKTLYNTPASYNEDEVGELIDTAIEFIEKVKNILRRK